MSKVWITDLKINKKKHQCERTTSCEGASSSFQLPAPLSFSHPLQTLNIHHIRQQLATSIAITIIITIITQKERETEGEKGEEEEEQEQEQEGVSIMQHVFQYQGFN